MAVAAFASFAPKFLARIFRNNFENGAFLPSFAGNPLRGEGCTPLTGSERLWGAWADWFGGWSVDRSSMGHYSTLAASGDLTCGIVERVLGPPWRIIASGVFSLSPRQLNLGIGTPALWRLQMAKLIFKELSEENRKFLSQPLIFLQPASIASLRKRLDDLESQTPPSEGESETSSPPSKPTAP